MANNLALLRGKHQISQTKLAEALGITKQGLCFAEKGRCSIALAKKASEYLGEDIYDVLGTDVFVIDPKSEAEKEKLIEIVRKFEVK